MNAFANGRTRSGKRRAGPKARIKLMVALGATSDVAQIRGMFEIAPAS